MYILMERYYLIIVTMAGTYEIPVVMEVLWWGTPVRIWKIWHVDPLLVEIVNCKTDFGKYFLEGKPITVKELEPLMDQWIKGKGLGTGPGTGTGFSPNLGRTYTLSYVNPDKSLNWMIVLVAEK